MDGKTQLVVRTVEGAVAGRWRAGMAEFRGIPYAQPPVGDLRFAAPVPVPHWDGTRQATEFGPLPPQSGPVQVGSAPETDWLTLNVSTPDPGAAGLPVLVWLPGGGYVISVSGDPTYDPTQLCADGLVVVSVNYRVGVEGFAFIDGAPANRGFLDQIAALEWVQRNISHFGGDPARVCVAGQSAGAGSVACLLVTTEAQGLFQRAIAHSVPGAFVLPSLAKQVTAALANGEDLRNVDPWELADSLTAFNASLSGHHDRWGPMAQIGAGVCPVLDETSLPRTPWSALSDGVDLLLGHTRDEFRLFSVMAGRAGTFTAEDAQLALDLFAPSPDGYRAGYPEASPSELMEIVYSDALFRMPSQQLAEANALVGGRSYLFELCLAAPGLGACHSLDVSLAFGTLDSPVGRQVFGEMPTAATLRVSEELRRAWASFAATGDPGWAAYRPGQRLTRVMDTESKTVPYPEEASRKIWERHTPAPFALPT
ncbi:carboxylesterase/lipase family protein [Amycolatopsis rubida]|uniref:Carboxylic ester hydrolase n=1 Tax=Amycolatopsis rubida TaxID=112413 RepID=A0ABX0BX56_9PSEU|nr:MULTISPECIES: carboxylesterase family protein [Amycolatopsis]MYW95226.1 carboxylesterase family protein [Amycolatopsis rubida]NEC60214.1 carboxylesterase/lipase family protein [Amycolatopsis rubida]OAP28377.1 Carboxylesterase [Amycolatopsis sp. M39]